MVKGMRGESIECKIVKGWDNQIHYRIKDESQRNSQNCIQLNQENEDSQLDHSLEDRAEIHPGEINAIGQENLESSKTLDIDQSADLLEILGQNLNFGKKRGNLVELIQSSLDFIVRLACEQGWINRIRKCNKTGFFLDKLSVPNKVSPPPRQAGGFLTIFNPK